MHYMARFHVRLRFPRTDLELLHHPTHQKPHLVERICGSCEVVELYHTKSRQSLTRPDTHESHS